MKEMIGALYFSDQAPHIVGHLKIGNQHYQISGVRVNKIRADIKATATGVQEEMFDEQPGEGGEGQCDLP